MKTDRKWGKAAKLWCLSGVGRIQTSDIPCMHACTHTDTHAGLRPPPPSLHGVKPHDQHIRTHEGTAPVRTASGPDGQDSLHLFSTEADGAWEVRLGAAG